MGFYPEFWKQSNILLHTLGFICELTKNFTTHNILVSCFEVENENVNDLLFRVEHSNCLQCMQIINYQHGVTILTRALKTRKPNTAEAPSSSNAFITFEFDHGAGNKGVFTLIDFAGIGVENSTSILTLKQLKQCMETPEQATTKLQQLLMNNFSTDYSIHLLICITCESDIEVIIKAMKFAQYFKKIIGKQLIRSKSKSIESTPLCTINEIEGSEIQEPTILDKVHDILKEVFIKESTRKLIEDKLRLLFQSNPNSIYVATDIRSMKRLRKKIFNIFNPISVSLCNAPKMGVNILSEINNMCEEIYHLTLQKNVNFESIIGNNISSCKSLSVTQPIKSSLVQP